MLDNNGTWHPLCDIQGCPHPATPTGTTEITVFLNDRFVTARIDLCSLHTRTAAPRTVEAG